MGEIFYLSLELEFTFLFMYGYREICYNHVGSVLYYGFIRIEDKFYISVRISIEIKYRFYDRVHNTMCIPIHSIISRNVQ